MNIYDYQRPLGKINEIACIPHVKYHTLLTADFAVTLINAVFPDNIDEAKKERETQIALLRSC